MSSPGCAPYSSDTGFIPSEVTFTPVTGNVRRAVAIVPARYASERFPGKPLAPIAGVPMVVRVLQNIQQARSLDDVFVATDDERIAAAVGDAGGRVVMTAPELPSGSDRVWAALADIEADVVVNVQGDEPLLPATVVDALVEALADEAFDIATPVVAVPRLTAASPDVVTVARDEHGAAHYFSRATIPHGADPVWRHVGVYAYRRAALERFVTAPPSRLEQVEKLEQLRALALGLRIAAVEVDVVLHAVDRPADVAVVERTLEGRTGAAGVAGVRLLVLDVDGVLTDGRISYVGDAEQQMSFDVKVGHGLVALRAAGLEVALLTGRDSPALRRRAAELGITELRAGVGDKAHELTDLCAALGVPLEAVCYIGDDEPDLPAMALAGVTAAPADASPAVRAAATIVLERAGGRGAVRELADLLLA
jgi:3-deoxy-manno-octulosonate cytidylyltransferase (CMP-KDO synthetase)